MNVVNVFLSQLVAKNLLKELQLLERRNKLSPSFCQWWGFCSAFQGLQLPLQAEAHSNLVAVVLLYINDKRSGLLNKKEYSFSFCFCVFLFGIWQVKSYFKRLPTDELGEGRLFEAHHCAQKIIIIMMFLELFVLLRFSFSSFLPFFFLCSNFFGHLLH